MPRKTIKRRKLSKKTYRKKSIKRGGGDVDDNYKNFTSQIGGIEVQSITIHGREYKNLKIRNSGGPDPRSDGTIQLPRTTITNVPMDSDMFRLFSDKMNEDRVILVPSEQSPPLLRTVFMKAPSKYSTLTDSSRRNFAKKFFEELNKIIS
jgi:hypothetical protein